MQSGAAGGDPSPFWKPARDLWAIQREALCPCPPLTVACNLGDQSRAEMG